MLELLLDELALVAADEGGGAVGGWGGVEDGAAEGDADEEVVGGVGEAVDGAAVAGAEVGAEVAGGKVELGKGLGAGGLGFDLGFFDVDEGLAVVGAVLEGVGEVGFEVGGEVFGGGHFSDLDLPADEGQGFVGDEALEFVEGVEVDAALGDDAGLELGEACFGDFESGFGVGDLVVECDGAGDGGDGGLLEGVAGLVAVALGDLVG